MKFGLNRRPSWDYAVKNGQDGIRSVPMKLRRQLQGPRARNTLMALGTLLLLFNWIVFGNAILGPFAKFSGKHSSFSNMVKPALLNVHRARHGFQGTNVIAEKSRLIAPIADDAISLKQITLENLFQVDIVKTGNEEKKIYKYGSDYFEDPQNVDETDKLEKAVANFKKLGRRVYKGNENPRVVIVTGLDFQRFDHEYLRKVLSNRAQYADKNKYGLYVRWAEEFIPRLQECNNMGTNWWRPMIMLEAMNAFPKAKYFWYLDEKSLIMRDDVELEDYMLKPEALDLMMLKGQSLMATDNSIKTYKNTDPSEVGFILSQDNYGLSTDSFILKSDVNGRAFMEFWGDKLYRQYAQFSSNDVKALAHIVRWHPYMLSHTALVPTRSINSMYTDAKAKKDEQRSYQKGDLVVNFRSCEFSNSCNSLAEQYLKEKSGTA